MTGFKQTTVNNSYLVENLKLCFIEMTYTSTADYIMTKDKESGTESKITGMYFPESTYT